MLHGYPQTWWSWHKVIPLLTGAEFRVIAPDYRGAGASTKPASGYDKLTLAGDLHTLVREHLGITDPVTIVGHDIGLMVGFAFASRFPADVAELVLVDAPLPGTAAFDEARAEPNLWHFAFHASRDFPEMLTAGREEAYIRAFITTRLLNAGAISPDDIDRYAAAYALPGAMRAGFELYREFANDGAANRAFLAAHGKLTTPVLAVAGDRGGSHWRMQRMAEEVATTVTYAAAPGSGHWVPEEAPQFLADAVIHFVAENRHL
nr:alpha/beta hydrolase [Herbiconiux sp. VKM Ac-1786]